ncbi:MAG: cytidylate kinase family protein, partial [Dehalococcoidales bacterium]|nr:cytidylate kinase family protein [Dehalococcoidales bacterium]
MPVVTIRGLLGSGAPTIGRLIADQLHVDYVDRKIISEVATRLKRNEQDIVDKEMPPGTVLGRIAEALGHSYGFEGVGLPPWEMPLNDTHYLQSLESIIRELAAGGS